MMVVIVFTAYKKWLQLPLRPLLQPYFFLFWITALVFNSVHSEILGKILLCVPSAQLFLELMVFELENQAGLPEYDERNNHYFHLNHYHKMLITHLSINFTLAKQYAYLLVDHLETPFFELDY